MNTHKIHTIIDGLRTISDDEFTCDNVYRFLSEMPVDIDSISPYFFWNRDCYTRNLIFKNERFEMLAICWEPGQESRVHDHADQKCWMTVPLGRLKGQNFAIAEIDESAGRCRLVETDSFELSDCLTAKVELEEPVHQILNLAEFDQRAVSIHIYSKPFDRCMSYCRDTDTFKEVPLYYTSVEGRLVGKASL